MFKVVLLVKHKYLGEALIKIWLKCIKKESVRENKCIPSYKIDSISQCMQFFSVGLKISDHRSVAKNLISYIFIIYVIQ